MFIRIIAYHATELIPGSDMRKVITESTHECESFWFKGDTLRDLYIERKNGTEKLLVIVGSCAMYFMNERGENFDKRYYHEDSRDPAQPAAAAA